MAISDRGFGSLNPEKRKAIASLGGKAAHQKGTAHEWTSDTARIAGRKGGRNSWVTRKAPATTVTADKKGEAA